MRSEMKKILALVDFSDAMPDVVRMAGRMARAFEATVYLVYVIAPESDYDGDELRKDVSRCGLAHEMRHKHRKLQLVQRYRRS
jgi:K+-sensing histidine kinase KdpD